MRNLFLLLLLSNLGLLAAVLWLVPEVPASRYDGPGITLLSEADPQARVRTPADAAVAAPDAAATDAGTRADRCVAIGPFIAPADADAALATLDEAGIESQVVLRDGEIWDGFWVYIEQIESMQAARQMLATLSENGVGDAYVIPNSDSGILISLGVFSEISRAGKQAERVGRLGYEATIADRRKTAQTRWLQIAGGAEVSSAMDLLTTPGQISRLEQRACRPPAAEAE